MGRDKAGGEALRETFDRFGFRQQAGLAGGHGSDDDPDEGRAQQVGLELQKTVEDPDQTEDDLQRAEPGDEQADAGPVDAVGLARVRGFARKFDVDDTWTVAPETLPV